MSATIQLMVPDASSGLSITQCISEPRVVATGHELKRLLVCFLEHVARFQVESRAGGYRSRF